MSLEIILLLLMILANGVFAMSEIAVVSARKPRLQQRAEGGDQAAAAALALANEPGDFLSAVQIGITLVGILAGAFGSATLAVPLARLLARVPWLANHSGSLALAIVVLSITYLSLVFGELVPKRLALNNPEQVASAVARPMRLVAAVTLPVVWLLSGSTALVLRLLGARPGTEPPVTEEEIRVMVSQGTEAGVFAAQEESLVAAVFRLGDLRAGALMMPRTEIDWLDLDAPPAEIQGKIIASTYSRFPVARGSLDNVAGVVHTRDLLPHCLAGQPLDLAAALRPALFVPETTPALQLLESFKLSGESMCLIIDEYGGLQGLVTVTDILEAVVGDLGAPGEAAQPHIVRREDGSWLVDGLTPIDEFREAFDLDSLPGEENNVYQTVGGFVMTHLGRIPEIADHFEWEQLRFEVVDMDERRVDKVLVTPLPAAEG